MKKFYLIMFTILLFLVLGSCKPDNPGGSNGLSFSVSGDRSGEISFDRIYVAADTDQIDIAFSTSGVVWPRLQINIRDYGSAVGTFTGGSSGPRADIQINYSASENYTTFNSENFTVTITQFDMDGGIAGTATIGDGGVLPDFSDTASVTLTPVSFDFSCSFVKDYDDPDDLPAPEPIN